MLKAPVEPSTYGATFHTTETLGFLWVWKFRGC